VCWLLLPIVIVAASCNDDDGARRRPTSTPTATATAAVSSPTSTVTASASPTASATPRPSATSTSAPPTATATATATETATTTLTPTPTTAVSPTPTVNCQVDGVICTIAGTGMSIFDGDGHPALETSFYFPIDLAFDRDERLLIMDWNNLRLRRLNDDGTISTIMGLDYEDFPTDGALASETPLHHASDVEFDASWNLYVAGDHVPVVFRVNGTDDRVFTVAGTADYGYEGDGKPALEALLSVPFGVLPDASGGFYISDVDANVVRYVDPEGIIHTAVGTGVAGYTGDGGAATAAQVSGPSRLQFGPDGALYFCEVRNHVVRRVSPDGIISTFAGTGQRGYSGDGEPATAAQLDSPYDLRFAPNGDLYVADAGNNVVRRIDANGVITTVVGSGEPGFAGDGRDRLGCEMKRPSSVVFDGSGALWIADTGNHRVRRVWSFLATVDAAPR
jgi:serine/threonine-protein kinase